MDDLPVFENFLSTQCGLNVNSARFEAVGFVNSFTALLVTSKAEIDDFVKTTHTTNSAHPKNGKIMIPTSATVALKALIFEIEYRARCVAILLLVTLQALDAVQLHCMHVQRTNSVSDKANFSALVKLPEITVPKLTANNYEIFTKALCYIVGRTIGINRISIDYVMCGFTGNYNSPWTNREDKVKNCLLHTGDSFKNDNITFYSLYYQYIGNEGVGSNIINKYHYTKNDCKYHQEFELNFRNDAHLINKATAATSTTNSAVYNGDSQKLHP